MGFESLVQIEKAPAPRAKKAVVGLGCDACPAKKTWKKGINPVFGKVRGKKLMIIAQNPGYNENIEKKELVGESGKWLWKELKKVGISRKDCDIQNAVRCMPTDGKDDDTGRWKIRTPSKEEISCCSKYTVKAIQKSKAKVYIIFGEIAAKQVCGREFKKNQRIFWSDTLKARVYCLDHPAFFLRGGSRSRLTQFRVALAAAAAEITGKHKGDPRYATLEKQDYKWITTIEEAEAEARLIRRAGAKGIRVAFDGEDDYLDKYKARMPLNMTTCFMPGRARNFLLYYPGIKVKRSVRRGIMAVVAGLLNDRTIPKAMHHGVSDDNASRRDFGVSVKNFHFDTEYSAFLKDPTKRAFGLKKLAESEFPEFSGYESVIIPWAIPKELPEDSLDEFRKQALMNLKASQQQQYNFYRKRGMLRYGQIPLKQFNLYACADADLCKRLERKTKDVSLPLLDVYVDSAWVLNRMEHNGPVFDFEHHKKLAQIYPPRLVAVKKKIAKIAGEDFNPASGAQVADFIYNVLKVKYPFPPKRGIKDNNTRKETMEFLGRTNKFCKLISIFRKLAKIVSTYLDSFEKCAIANYGRLRTKWWLTGTKTGRLASGGTKDESVDVVINLQNVHGDATLQNQAVADKHWRKCYDYAVARMHKVVGSKLMKKLAKYADDPTKLLDRRDDEGVVVDEGLISKIKAKLKAAAWQQYAEEVIEKYGDTKIFLGFDFGQIEVRILAQLSGDKNLIEDCKSGDIHSKVGHAMTGWAIEKIKKDKKTRTLTKNIHFGIMYGLSPDGVYNFILAKDPDIQVTREDVYAMYEAYFKRYPGVKKLTEKLRTMAEEKGYVENMFGFRRPLNTNDNVSEEDADESDTGAYWGNQAINCVDYKTEALTQRGWIAGADVKKGDVLLTFNKERGTLEWQSAFDVKQFPNYKGQAFKLKSRSFNSVSTPDHRWPIALKDGTFSEKITGDFVKPVRADYHIPRVGKYLAPKTPVFSDVLVRLVGWILTDGVYPNRKRQLEILRNKGYAGTRVQICQSQTGNPEKVKQIDNLFLDCTRELPCFKFRTKEAHNRTKDEVFWSFSGYYGQWMRATFPDRTLTTEFLCQLTRKQLKLLRDTMLAGDGHYEPHRATLSSGRKQQVDNFQVLCVMLGQNCSVLSRDMSKYKPISNKMINVPNMGTIHLARTQNRTQISTYNLKRKEVMARGMWCPMVPNSFFVARRNGQSFITGNTPIQGAAHHLMLMAVATLRRKKKKYLKLLGIPTMEVHDALYFFIKLKDIIKASALGKKLLEVEPLQVIKKAFPKVYKKWDMPLAVEGKAGLRLGDTVEIEQDGESMPIYDVLAEMVVETYLKECVLELELARAA